MVNALSPVEGKHALWAGAHFGNVGLAKSLKNKSNTWNIGVIAKLTANLQIYSKKCF